MWCWKRLLRVPWTASKSNQSILREINPEFSLEGLMLKLKLQYLGDLMQTADSLEKILRLGKLEGRRRRGWQRIRWLNNITNSMSMNLSKLADSGRQGSLACCSPWGCKVLDMTEWLNNLDKTHIIMISVHILCSCFLQVSEGHIIQLCPLPPTSVLMWLDHWIL